ncbi:MAG: PAS domain S-box protein [Candidatus Dadabacteria bacterium]|nr:MAG: PAS domain S-box protein [Candidatus Dadabacteria bacterium]
MGPEPGAEQRILDSLGWGVLVVGRWSRVIHAFNRRMEELSGISRAEAVGRPVAEVFGHLKGLDFEALDAEIRATGGFEARAVRLERPGGEVVYRHLRGDVLEGGAGGEPAVIVSVQDVTEREFLRWSLTRYLSREVVDLVLGRGREGPIEGREVDAAVLVADMRGFTGAAEGLTPQELFDTLNAYLGPMVEVVAARRGMIDKFVGDGFMAVFGLEAGAGDEVAEALRAALDLRDRVAAVTRERGPRGLPTLGLGYAVHWGPAVAGTVGGDLRMEYTLVGDTVNVAHRVQEMAGPGEILVTRPAARAAGDGFRWGEPRWVRVRGRKAPVKIAPLLGEAGRLEG